MSEMAVNRKQTRAYIATNPSTVVLERIVKAPDGAGGFTSTPTALAPQTVRMIHQQGGGDKERKNRDGEVVRPSLVLQAEWDADVQEGDRFTWQGYDLEVVYVQDLGYELLCEVATI